MSGFTAAGISTDTVTTTQQAPLGFVLTVPDGDNGNKVYTYVYNDSGSDIGINLLVERKNGSATYAVAIAEAAATVFPAQIVGATFQTGGIPNGSYGFVLSKGVVTLTCDAAVAADDGLINDPSTAGNVTVAAAITGMTIGYSLGGRVDAGTFTGFLNCVG